MIRLLSRWQPSHPVLAVLYWLALVALAVAILFVLFFVLDAVFGLAPFDQPGL